MAKKKENLSPEELLEQALVPEQEWPYEVPENWVWTYIDSGFDVTSSKRVLKDQWQDDGVPFYRTRELVKLSKFGVVDNELFISNELFEQLKSEYGVPKAGDLLVSGVGTIGVPYVVTNDQEFYFKDGNVIWLKNQGLFNPKYVYYAYKSDCVYNQIKSYSSGTTVDTYTIINAKKTIIPLPPLAEQQRILDRIESLFEKLDQARGLIQDALDSFENRKAAILHKAFSGELTKKWREENGVGMESWEETELGEQVSKLGDGLHGTPIYSEHGEFYFINGNNFNRTYIEIKADTKKVDLEEFMKYRKNIGENTVFVSINGTLGKTAFYNGEPVILGKSACYFNVGEKLDKRFIRYYMETKEFLNYASTMATGSTIKNLSLKAMRTLPLSLPTIEEQVEIINVLDGIIENELKSYELIALNHELDLMKKSILSRAFRGELGTNDQDEESAIHLLEKMFTENGGELK